MRTVQDMTGPASLHLWYQRRWLDSITLLEMQRSWTSAAVRLELSWSLGWWGSWGPSGSRCRGPGTPSWRWSSPTPPATCCWWCSPSRGCRHRNTVVSNNSNIICSEAINLFPPCDSSTRVGVFLSWYVSLHASWNLANCSVVRRSEEGAVERN